MYICAFTTLLQYPQNNICGTGPEYSTSVSPAVNISAVIASSSSAPVTVATYTYYNYYDHH